MTGVQTLCSSDLGFSPNYVSEHEMMFTAQGVKTKFLIAAKGALENPPDLTKRK